MKKTLFKYSLREFKSIKITKPPLLKIYKIKVLYKNGSSDEFSFYISNEKLHLVDFSFDKELYDVGVKPSGEPIVHVDVLSNALINHFKETVAEEYAIQVFLTEKRELTSLD